MGTTKLSVVADMMKFIIEYNKIDWWYWAVTLALIFSALLGWEPGYYLVMVISTIQVVYFWIRQNNLFDFDVQVRIVYLLFTLLGLYEPVRFPLYLILFLGTLMVVFFDRCGIALFLKLMPWNKETIVQIQK